MENSNYSKGFVIGALVGGVAGAVTALLLAPKSGQELRKDIADTSTDIYSRASEYLTKLEGQARSAVNSTVKDSKVKAQAIVDSAREKAENLLTEAETVLKDAKTKANDAKESVQNKINTVRDASQAGIQSFKEELNK